MGRSITRCHMGRCYAALLLILSCISSLINVVEAAPADDFIKAIKLQLPPHQEFESLEISDIEDRSNPQMAMSKSNLKIKIKVKEDLYRMKSYKAGKYELVLATKKGETLERLGVGIALPAMAGMGKVKVILLPDPNANVMPLSRYKTGTYEIVTSDAETQNKKPANQQDDETVHPAVAAMSGLINPAQKPSQNITTAQTTPVVSNQHVAIKQLLDIYNAQGAVYGSFGGVADKVVVLKEIIQNKDGSLSGKIEYPEGSTYELDISSENNLVVRLREGKQLAFNGASRPPGVYDYRVMNNLLLGKVNNKSVTFPLTLETNRILKGNYAKNTHPWRNVEDRVNFIMVGRILWDLESMKAVKNEWLMGPITPIDGIEDFFLRTEIKSRLAIKPYGTYDAGFGTGGEVSTPGTSISFDQSKGTNWLHNWLHHDMQRFVGFRDGDIWTGSVSWKKGATSNVRNLTNLGILNNISLLSWYKDTIYVRREDGGNKPIIRLNLTTGKLHELADHTAFATHGSPDGRFMFASGWKTDKGTLHVYDAETQTFFTLKSAYNLRRYGGIVDEDPMPFTVSPLAWLNEYTFLDNYGWYDLKNRHVLLFSDIPELTRLIPVNTTVSDTSFLPDTDYIDVIVRGNELTNTGQAGKQLEKRVVINRTTKKVTELPMQHRLDINFASVTWIDTQRYVYTVSKGGLSEVGVWLYDVNRRKSRRLSPISLLVNGATNWVYRDDQYNRYIIPEFQTNPILFIPARNEIAYTSLRGDKVDLVVIDIASGNVRKADVTHKNSLYKLSLISPHTIKVE